MYRKAILSSPTWEQLESSGIAARHKINLPSLLDAIKECPETVLSPYRMSKDYFKKYPVIIFNRKIFCEGIQMYSLPIIFEDNDKERKLDISAIVKRNEDNILIMYVYSEGNNEWYPSMTGLLIEKDNIEDVDFVAFARCDNNTDFALSFSRLICNILLDVFSRESNYFCGTLDDINDSKAGHC